MFEDELVERFNASMRLSGYDSDDGDLEGPAESGADGAHDSAATLDAAAILAYEIDGRVYSGEVCGKYAVLYTLDGEDVADTVPAIAAIRVSGETNSPGMAGLRALQDRRSGYQLKGLMRFALLNGIKRMYVFCAIARASGLLTRAMWAQALAERRYPAAVPWEDTCLWAQVLCAMGQLARAIQNPAILFHRPSRMGRSVLRVEQFLAAAMAWAGDVVFAAAGLHLNDAAHHGKIYNHVKIAEEKSRFCAMEAILDSAARGM